MLPLPLRLPLPAASDAAPGAARVVRTARPSLLAWRGVPCTLDPVPIRIVLERTDDAAESPAAAAGVRSPGPGDSADTLLPSGDGTGPPLLLWVAQEPEIGLRFAYDGLVWEIVDYRDGWIARLVTG